MNAGRPRPVREPPAPRAVGIGKRWQEEGGSLSAQRIWTSSSTGFSSNATPTNSLWVVI